MISTVKSCHYCALSVIESSVFTAYSIIPQNISIMVIANIITLILALLIFLHFLQGKTTKLQI